MCGAGGRPGAWRCWTPSCRPTCRTGCAVLALLWAPSLTPPDPADSRPRTLVEGAGANGSSAVRSISSRWPSCCRRLFPATLGGPIAEADRALLASEICGPPPLPGLESCPLWCLGQQCRTPRWCLAQSKQAGMLWSPQRSVIGRRTTCPTAWCPRWQQSRAARRRRLQLAHASRPWAWQGLPGAGAGAGGGGPAARLRLRGPLAHAAALEGLPRVQARLPAPLALPGGPEPPVAVRVA